jgi:hypothetical protein
MNIFSRLVPADSIVLGLTCKTLYAIHLQLHGQIRLTAISALSANGQRIPLYCLLGSWWGPNWVLGRSLKLIRREMWETEERERLELISDFIVVMKREREEEERLEDDELGGIGTVTLTCNLLM